MILFEMKLRIYLQRWKKIVYNILVNGEIVSENVLKSDIQHKIKIIHEYYKYSITSQSHEDPIITVVLNKSETIA